MNKEGMEKNESPAYTVRTSGLTNSKKEKLAVDIHIPLNKNSRLKQTIEISSAFSRHG